MSKELKHKVDFNLIRYANCWEDADILIEGLNAQPGDKILSIGSAGDNSFSLLTTNPSMVVAVDVNKIQLHLIELKKACFKKFERIETLGFLGFEPSSQRKDMFERLKPLLTDEVKAYWELNYDQIEAGIIHQGKFEKYFQLFAFKILPWIHSEKTTEDLLRRKLKKEQEVFYQKKWNTWRWRMLFKIFFSKYVMGKYGRDPEFLKEVKVPVGQTIFKKAENHLRGSNAQTNFILRYNLTGDFGMLLPHYLQDGNYEIIKTNIDKLQILEGYAEEAFRIYGKFNRFNLSNIFEYMNPELFAKTAKEIEDNCEMGGRVAYWNLMVPRNFSDVTKMKYLQSLSEELSEKDKGFFYKQFNIDEKC
jgi:S-adenosylmethionine-diacylglycerol 3-amino-3-carboxypropyl transferase